MLMGIVWYHVHRYLWCAALPAKSLSRCNSSAMIVMTLVEILILLSSTTNSQLILNLTSGVNGQNSALKYVAYCLKCPDPSKEGSLLLGLNAKFGPQQFSITGELVYCVPNYGERERLLNSHQFVDRIVLVERGKVSMLEKVLRIQHQSTANAIIIADDGSCDESFNYCGPRLGSINDGGFAAFDDASRWSEVEIPVMLVTQLSAEKLRTLMRINQINVRGYGVQNVTVLDSDDEL